MTTGFHIARQGLDDAKKIGTQIHPRASIVDKSNFEFLSYDRGVESFP
jgi:hypothetical protein